jgi:putative Ca2+/H+ antiporter (TMEM165/GDT1 family)
VEALLVSISTVALAEMGDRTQLLTLVLAAHFRRPWTILAGITCATLANHALAGIVGRTVARALTPRVVDIIVGVSLVAMGVWALRSDALDQVRSNERQRGAFLATLIAFFIAEIGDRTQIATVALAAAYPSLVTVVAGTTLGMLLANAPAVFLGHTFADRLPLRYLQRGSAVLFLVLGVVFLWRGYVLGR